MGFYILGGVHVTSIHKVPYFGPESVLGCQCLFSIDSCRIQGTRDISKKPYCCIFHCRASSCVLLRYQHTTNDKSYEMPHSDLYFAFLARRFYSL